MYHEQKETASQGKLLRLDNRPNLLSHLRGLHVRDWLLLVRMVCMLVPLLILKHIMSLPALIKLYDANPVSPGKTTPERLVWLTDGFLRRFSKNNRCMNRSIILFHFLRKWDYPVRIHFGVAKRGEKLDGHAWIELSDIPLAESTDPTTRFHTMYVYPELAAENGTG